MVRAAIADTGPLVAFFDRGERHHAWAAEHVRELSVPLLVCEPVLAETMYLLSGLPRAQDALFELLENGALRVGFQLEEQVPALRALHRKYRDAGLVVLGVNIDGPDSVADVRSKVAGLGVTFPIVLDTGAAVAGRPGGTLAVLAGRTMPHSSQNFAPSRTLWPQLGQII